MVSFRLKSVKLVEALGAVSEVVGELNSKLAPFKAATKAFAGENGIALYKEVLALEGKLEAVQIKLNGDRDYAELDLDAPFALRQRARSVIGDIMGSTSNVPGSSKRNYEIAADEFAPILEEVKSLQNEFKEMEQKLGNMNAPLIRGMLPDWKK